MKNVASIENLRPSITGNAAALPFEAFLGILSNSGSQGIARATAEDGARFEVRFVDGSIVRVAGRDGQDTVSAAAELIRSDALDFSFRPTPGAPQGDFEMALDQLLLKVAFSA